MGFQYDNYLIKSSNRLIRNLNSFKFAGEDEKDISKIESSDVILVYFDENFAQKVKICFTKLANHFQSLAFFDGGAIAHPQIENYLVLREELAKENVTLILLDLPESHLANSYNPSAKNDVLISNTIYESLYKINKEIGYLGFQRQTIDLDLLLNLDENSMNSASLGMLRKYPLYYEPILRTVGQLTIHLNALKSSENGDYSNNLPTGITAEELCQYCRISGASNKSFNLLFCMNEHQKQLPASASIIANCMWYYLEGIYHRKSFAINFVEQLIVNVKDVEDTLIFAIDNENKWWVKLDTTVEHDFFPCTFEEYDLTLKGELPHRLFKLLSY